MRINFRIALLLLSLCFYSTNAHTQLIKIQKTGQTSCYDTDGVVISCAGSGEDGEYQLGAAWAAPRFVDNEDDTFTDTLTGLIWLVDGNCAGTVGHDPDETADGTMVWANVLEFADMVNSGSYPTCAASYDDWRVPNANELESLLNSEYYDSTWLEGFGFYNIDGGAYWSSTTSTTFFPDNGIFVDFYAGALSNTWKLDVGKAWLVRSGPQGTPVETYPANLGVTGQVTSQNTADDGDLQQGISWPNPRFTDNEDGTITDELTGLIWLEDANCISSTYSGYDMDGAVPWQSALDFVNLINDGTYPDCGAGQTDWRLPNRRELRSLADYENNNPALPTGHPFINVVSSGSYWSSTTYASSTSWAWYLYMRAGDVGGAPKTTNYCLWPVRGTGAQPASDPEIELSKSAIDFGNVTQWFTSTTATLMISNNGGDPLILSGITITGDDAASIGVDTSFGASPCGSHTPTISGGNSCTVGLNFSPTVLGIATANLMVASNDPVSPTVSISLSGTGTKLFPDNGLESAVLTAIDKALEDITQEDLDALTTLTAISSGITELSGLERLTNLAYLNLSGNSIDDLSALSDLTGITYLNLYDNQIVDISPLAGLTSLGYLNLGRNVISDISTVDNFNILTDLYLDENQISDISVLSAMGTLINLGLASNELTSIEVLADNTELAAGDRLWISDNLLGMNATAAVVADIRTIQDRGATVYHDAVIPLFADANLETAMREVLALPTQILIPDDCSGLTSLDISSRNITSLEGLEQCRGITSLTAFDNLITDYEPATNLRGLTNLNLSMNQLTAVHALTRRLSALRVLNLSSNQITDISALYDPDYWPVNELERLYLSSNLLTSIATLEHLENLEELSLSFNQITDLNPLVDNPGIAEGDKLWLGGNPLGIVPVVDSPPSSWARILDLEERGVIVDMGDVNYFTDPGLEAAVRDALEKPIGSLSPAELNSLSHLDASDRGIGDIAGIVYCYSLKYLYLDQNNSLMNIRPIANLKITHLGLSHTAVDDLSPLGVLGTVEDLDLQVNPSLFSISPLSMLLSLKYLKISDTFVSDLSPLMMTTSLRELEARKALIDDITPLAGLTNLYRVVLTSNQITDLAPLVDNSGIGAGDIVSVDENPLGLFPDSENVAHILTLDGRGVTVTHDPFHSDADGLSDIEEEGPDGTNPEYDGNGDSIADGEQDNVSSFHTYDGSGYVTLSCPEEMALTEVLSLGDPSGGYLPEGIDFEQGFFSFTITEVAPGGRATVVLKLSENSEPTTYYKFGPEAGAPENHWYEFLYDGDTGAVIEGNVITLHFVDGGRGDDDLDANGEIVEPGGPGWINASDDGNSSGSCFLETLTNLQDAKVKR